MNEKEKSAKTKSVLMTVGMVIGVVVVLGVCFYLSSKKEPSKSYVLDTTAEQYFELFNGEEKSVVLLASDTCTYCIKFQPTVKKLSSDYELNVYYVNVNTITEDNYIRIHDASASLKEKYNSYGQPVIPTPTTVIVQNGAEVAALEGNNDYDTLEKFLKDNGVI